MCYGGDASFVEALFDVDSVGSELSGGMGFVVICVHYLGRYRTISLFLCSAPSLELSK